MSDASYAGRFELDFQARLLAVLLRDQKVALSYRTAIDHQFFEAAHHRSIAKSFLAHIDKHRTKPSKELIIELCKETTPKPSQKPIIREIERLYTMELTDAAGITDKIVEFGQESAAVNAVIKCAEYINEKQRDKILPTIKESLAVGQDLADVGSNYVTDSKTRTQLYLTNGGNVRKLVPTGIPHLDAAMYGGLGRGEVGTILAPPKRGKCVSINARLWTAERGYVAAGIIAQNPQAFRLAGVHKEDGIPTAARIEHVHKTGRKPCVNVRMLTQDLENVATTHLVATHRGWIPAGDLRTGDYVVRPRGLPVPSTRQQLTNDVKLALMLPVLYLARATMTAERAAALNAMPWVPAPWFREYFRPYTDLPLELAQIIDQVAKPVVGQAPDIDALIAYVVRHGREAVRFVAGFMVQLAGFVDAKPATDKTASRMRVTVRDWGFREPAAVRFVEAIMQAAGLSRTPAQLYLGRRTSETTAGLRQVFTTLARRDFILLHEIACDHFPALVVPLADLVQQTTHDAGAMHPVPRELSRHVAKHIRGLWKKDGDNAVNDSRLSVAYSIGLKNGTLHKSARAAHARRASVHQHYASFSTTDGEAVAVLAKSADPYTYYICQNPHGWDRVVAVEDAGVQSTVDFSVPPEIESYVVDGALTHNSTMLINLGFGALLNPVPKTVVHYTLEMNVDLVESRYDTRLMGHRQHLLKVDPERYVQELERRLGLYMFGTLITKRFPANAATVMDLEANLQYLRTMDVIPDLIIVDYAGLLRVPRPIDTRVDLISVYTDLRTLAQDHDAALWTGHQATTNGFEKDTLTMTDFSEARGVAAVVDAAFAFCQTPNESLESRARLFAVVQRNAPDGLTVEIQADRTLQRITSTGLFNLAYEPVEHPSRVNEMNHGAIERAAAGGALAANNKKERSGAQSKRVS